MTVSFAVPGSVIDNAQTAEMAAVIAGQVARTAAIYNVAEIVVLDDAAPKECVSTVKASGQNCCGVP